MKTTIIEEGQSVTLYIKMTYNERNAVPPISAAHMAIVVKAGLALVVLGLTTMTAVAVTGFPDSFAITEMLPASVRTLFGSAIWSEFGLKTMSNTGRINYYEAGYQTG